MIIYDLLCISHNIMSWSVKIAEVDII
uniref:Uncharacterized protein n=1 Tax=Rhizophora mucronata TaxID=61149 RepID=A0A2P2QT70_RHIMU